MPRTPDRAPGVSDEEGTDYELGTANAAAAGQQRYNGSSGKFSMFDAVGEFDPRGAASTPLAHRQLDQLVHEIAETSFTEVIKSGGFVTNVIIRETAAKLKKIRECAVSRTGAFVTQVVTQQYDAAGLLVETLTETINRTGGLVTDITAVLT